MEGNLEQAMSEITKLKKELEEARSSLTEVVEEMLMTETEVMYYMCSFAHYMLARIEAKIGIGTRGETENPRKRKNPSCK